MIYNYLNFDWRTRNPITNGYKNEVHYRSEYEHKKGSQEEISLEDEVEIHDPMEDKNATQEMGEEKDHEDDPNIISE